MTLILFVILIYMIAILFICKGRLEPLFITIFFLSQILIGYYLIEPTGDIWVIYLFSILSFILGYSFMQLFIRMNKVNEENINKHYMNKLIPEKTLIAFTFFMVIYHYVIGGIPLFSDNVEVTRFSFNSSGLFGIPGRMFLFGLPFILMYATLLNYTQKKQFSNKLLAIIWIGYIVLKLFSGFKGVLLEVIIFSLFILSVNRKSLPLKSIFSFKYIFYGLLSGIFAVYISFQYQSLSLRTLSEVINYLLIRLTIMPAEPGYFAINNVNYFLNQGIPLINEFIYFLEKYFKFELSSTEKYPIDMIVSSNIYNTPLSFGNFIVPVTVGGFPVLYLSTNQFVSVMTMFLLGLLYSFIFYKSKNIDSVFFRSTLGMVLYSMHVFILNGGFWYLLINVSSTILMLYIIKLIISIILTKKNSESNY